MNRNNKTAALAALALCLALPSSADTKRKGLSAETPPAPFDEELPMPYSALKEVPSEHLTLSPRQIVLSGSKQILPFVNSSSGSFTSLIVTNITDSRAEFSFTIRDMEGSPLEMPFRAGSSTRTEMAAGVDNVTLAPYEQRTLFMRSQSPTRTGWIDFTSKPDASVVIGAYVITRQGIARIEPSELYRSASVPADRVDSALDNTLFVINPSRTRGQRLTIRYLAEGIGCEGTLNLDPLGQAPVNIQQSLPCFESSLGGVLEIEGEDEFSGLLFSEFENFGLFTTSLIDRSSPRSGPSFGSARVGNRTYEVGTAIGTLVLAAASGGSGELTYSLSPSVPGLSFSPSTRSLTGTPTAAGKYRMTYTVTDAGGDSDTLSFVLTVTSLSTPPVAPDEYTPLDIWKVSSGTVRFIFPSNQCLAISNLTASGTTYTVHNSKWQTRAGSSSAWTDVANTAHTGGVCPYVPTEPGQYRGVAEITVNGERGKYASNVLTIGEGDQSSGGQPSFGSATVANRVYTTGTTIATLRLPTATGGDGTVTFSLSPGIPGLTFNAASRSLSGTPSSAGAYSMTYTAQDADGDTARLRFIITVRAGDLRPSFGSATVSSQTYTSGTAIATLRLPAASGGDGTLTYGLTPSVPGLTFSASSRTLSGTPSSTGSYSMMYTARDADGDTVTLRFTITVSQQTDTGDTSGSATRYEEGDTITNMPTGFIGGSYVGGVSAEFGGGGSRLRFRQGAYIQYRTYRWTCASSGGCEVRDRVVHTGTIVETEVEDN